MEIIEQYHLIGNIAVATIALIIWFVGKRIFRSVEQRYGENFEDANRKTASAITGLKTVLRIVFVVVLVIVLLEVNGINIAGLVTSLGIGTAVVGLALQDLFKDVIMGVRISSENQYVTGDVIRYEGQNCVVERFTLRTTRLKSIDTGDTMFVCNRNIGTVCRPSHLVDMDLSLSYEENAGKIHRTLQAAVEEIKKLEDIEDAEYKGTQSFDASAIVYKVRFFCNPINKPEVWRSVMKVVQQALNENNIEIPYDHVTITYEKQEHKQ